MIETINRKYAMTIVIVTHNEVIQRMAHYTIKIKDGKVANFSENPTPATANSLEW